MGNMGRRQFFQNAAVAAAGLGLSGLPFGSIVARASTGQSIPTRLLTKAGAALAIHGDRIANRRLMAIADFSTPSATPRFHLYDLITGDTTTLLVSHGKGSDPSHSGWVQQFSNVPGSEATSEGAYLVGETYYGKYGESRRLIGLEPQNDQAENRAIVIHPAWYVSQSIAEQQGKVGRSQGCFAFSFDDIGQVLTRVAPGSLLYAGKV
jgi:hypothetical protein